MNKEEIFNDLQKIFKSSEQYTVVDFILKNAGTFISSLSVVFGFFLLCAKFLGYLINKTQYQFWEIDEEFLLVDNHSYISVGVIFAFIVLCNLASYIARKYIYLWEIYDCEIYLIEKICVHQKEIHDETVEQLVASKEWMQAMDAGFSYNKEKTSQLRMNVEEAEKLCDDFNEHYSSITRNIKKLRWKHFSYLVYGYIIIFFASFILQSYSGVSAENESVLNVLIPSLVNAVILMISVWFTCWYEVKKTFKKITKYGFEHIDEIWDDELIDRTLDLLEEKAQKTRWKSLKESISDNFCISTFYFTLSIFCIGMILLPKYSIYNIKEQDSFYVFNEEGQDYVMLINNGTEYICSECKIEGEAEEKIIINSSAIYITNEPIKMEKKTFDVVEKLKNR